MEVEINRHNWEYLRVFAGNAKNLPGALRQLAYAITESEADAAFRLIEGAISDQGLLSESCLAVSSCLVHALWRCSDVAEGRILELLAIVAGGSDILSEDSPIGDAGITGCMEVIKLGFPVYCENLELSSDLSKVVSTIDLVLACGLSDAALRDPAKASLGAALTRSYSDGIIRLARSSLADLNEVEDA